MPAELPTASTTCYPVSNFRTESLGKPISTEFVHAAIGPKARQRSWPCHIVNRHAAHVVGLEQIWTDAVHVARIRSLVLHSSLRQRPVRPVLISEAVIIVIKTF